MIKSKLPDLFANYHGEEKVYKIKDCLPECLLLSARLLNKESLTKQEVDSHYKKLMAIIAQDDINFKRIGKGMIRSILIILSFALQHSEISHTLKQNSLEVAYKILQNSTEYEMVDMIRVAQSYLKQEECFLIKQAEGTESSMSPFTRDLLLTANDVEKLVILTKIPEYHSLQMQDLFEVLLNLDITLPES